MVCNKNAIKKALSVKQIIVFCIVLPIELPAKNLHLPSASTRIKSLTTVAFVNIPRREFRVEIRNEALCALGKASRTGLQIDIFRKRFYEPKFFHLL